MKTVKITEIQTYPLIFPGDETDEYPVACPMSIYPEYRSSRRDWRDDFGSLLVRIVTDAGVEGIGFTFSGGLVCALTINLHFKRLLIGNNPLDSERLHDILVRSSYHQGRDGYLMHAISALDLALWDIRGKLAGLSVCQLLGGPAHDSLPCYLTGYNVQKVKQENFTGIKWPLKYGPASGRQGLDDNVQDIAQLREALGPEPDIMLDCWMGLDVPYTIELSRALHQFDIKWIEEPLIAGNVEGYRHLRRKLDDHCWLACGEHETLVRGAELFFKDRLVDVWQADVLWAGGITEMQKIGTLALEAGVTLIPHLGSLPWAAHFIFAYPASQTIEYYDATLNYPGGNSLYDSDIELHNGRLYPGNEPGFGININWEVVEQYLDRRVEFKP